ncbi:hypothetical protein BCR44DRAFT_1147382 [Catenaria anguillulae PL171]|uniref:Uncharacterized protein n=1 Tax=Catenaria anguillulae PL171 TaxID=765915 RepID=A0A1Y2HIW5_9FUNG|nr:hypothetical protein BCR44DRAFT_1147382 [Catenaria anguillulae PL171]
MPNMLTSNPPAPLALRFPPSPSPPPLPTIRHSSPSHPRSRVARPDQSCCRCHRRRDLFQEFPRGRRRRPILPCQFPSRRHRRRRRLTILTNPIPLRPRSNSACFGNSSCFHPENSTATRPIRHPCHQEQRACAIRQRAVVHARAFCETPQC